MMGKEGMRCGSHASAPAARDAKECAVKGGQRGWQNGRVCDEGCAVRGAKQNGERRKGNDWGNV